MPNGVILRDYPEEVEPTIEVKSVSRNMREFLSRTQEHHRIGATLSILQRKTRAPTIVALRPRVNAKSYLARVRKNIPSRQHSRFVGPFDKCVTHRDWTQRQVQKTRADPRENSLHTKGICCADHGTYIDSVQREFYDAYMAACSTPSNCDGGLEDHVPKRQFDLATRMMSEQASLSSTWDYE